MIIEILGTMAGEASEIIRYRATRRLELTNVEGVNRTRGCSIALGIAPHGAASPSNAVGLMFGATNFPGDGLIWTGSVILEPDEEVWAIINNPVAGDICDLSIKMRAA